jgi:hypothetical protein
MRLLLRPFHRWIWRDDRRRAHNLLRFAEVEADGGRDLVRAAEVTADPLLRRLFLAHAGDEQRHADLFHKRGIALRRTLLAGGAPGVQADWLAPGERGLDDLRVEREPDGALLAFLHLSEKAAARDFAGYRDVLDADPATRDVFETVLRDEGRHMTYTHAQLLRVAPRRHRAFLWRARLGRLWKAYLRLAAALAGAVATIVLTLQYFILLPPFAITAQRAARREAQGWRPVAAERAGALKRQY